MTAKQYLCAHHWTAPSSHCVKCGLADYHNQPSSGQFSQWPATDRALTKLRDEAKAERQAE